MITKTKLPRILLVPTFILVMTLGTVCRAQTTAFTFQGRLNSAGGAANGSYDMTFAVWNANVAGSQIAGPITNSAVAVSNGLFTVTLDFGNGVFTGTNYWVEMGVRNAGGGSFATLAPRQQLTPAPYALSLVSPQATALCPSGSVLAYMGASAPNGWLLCDGSAVSRTTFASLFAVIGTNSGAGDGSTTFNLPDMRGRVVVGAGQGTNLSNRLVGQSFGEETHTLTVAEMPAHNHNVHDTGHSHDQRFWSGGSGSNHSFTHIIEGGSVVNQGITTGSSTANIVEDTVGGGAAHNIMQPGLVMNYIIKY